MDEKEFRQEIEHIREDIEDFSKPYSPCEYFHGREGLFDEAQFRRAVEFFLHYQQERFEKERNSASGNPIREDQNGP